MKPKYHASAWLNFSRFLGWVISKNESCRTLNVHNLAPYLRTLQFTSKLEAACESTKRHLPHDLFYTKPSNKVPQERKGRIVISPHLIPEYPIRIAKILPQVCQSEHSGSLDNIVEKRTGNLKTNLKPSVPIWSTVDICFSF